MKHVLAFIAACISVLTLSAQTFRMDNPLDKAQNGFITFTDVPDGNYRVTITVGSADKAGATVIRGESRRLFYETIVTKKGEFKEVTFIINKRNTQINESDWVQIKPREKAKLNWDNNLTVEISGANPQAKSVVVTAVSNVTTIFLCGNSTVVDQDNEPWASWGQMIPRFFNNQVSFANYAESGESANTFIAAGRFKKILTQMKAGDYIFIEFGHNDQKQIGPGKGPYLHYYNSLKEMIDQSREKGGIPVLVTPTQRRSFNEKGKILDTHGDYPAAMKKLAADAQVPLIDLHAMTRTLYEALGDNESKKAFVHYPANSFPGQTKALEDNTHFNPYGAYQIAKCVIEGMKDIDLPLVQHLRPDVSKYSPDKPDKVSKFEWFPSAFFEVEKPDGN